MTIDQELFQPLVLGLLVVTIAFLVSVLATLSRIKRGLEGSGKRSTEPGAGSSVAAPDVDVRQAGEAPTADTRAEPGTVAEREDFPREQPFERDERWWYFRDDELLVYDETTGQWVPTEPPPWATGGVTDARRDAESQGTWAEFVEATEVSTSQPPADEPAGLVEASEPHRAVPATEIPEHPLDRRREELRAAGLLDESAEVGDNAELEDETGLRDDAAPEAAAEDEVTPQTHEPTGSFWKCPSCGAVNGSTATTCRMCFSERPQTPV